MFRLKNEDPAFGASHLVRWLLLVVFFGPTMVCGNDIKTLDTVGNVGRYTSLALDAKDNSVVSYHDHTNRDLKLLHCDEPSCQADESSSISLPDTEGMVGTYTSLALDDAGKPVVSYYDSTSGVLKLLRCRTPDCASRNISIADSASIVGMYTSLTLDDTGNPVVSYYDDSNGDLKLLHCDDPHCKGNESKNIAIPDNKGDVGLYTSLALDNAGNPVISYYASNSGLRLLHCDDPGCKGDESANITTPDAGDVGWFSSIVLDAAGNPVVSYYNFSSGDLKILHCDDPNCAGDESGNITIPDAVSNVGSYLSMVLDVKGNPVISYFDSSNGDLKLLHCDDPNCAGGEAGNIVIPDAKGDVGSHTSIALDAAGNPVVSYYDFSNGDLKLLHCANPTCNSK